MGHSQKFEEDREKLRTKTHEFGDTISNELGEKNQHVQVGVEELEDSIKKILDDTAVAHCEDNQECAPSPPPSPPEQQQELRNRVRSKVRPGQEPGLEEKSEPEGSNNESSEVRKPGESDCKPVQSLFQDTLKRLQKLLQNVLGCMQDCISLVEKVKTILIDIDILYSSVAKCFSSLCQA